MDYSEDIQSCTNSGKATKTNFTPCSKVKHHSKRNSSHEDHSYSRSYGYDDALSEIQVSEAERYGKSFKLEGSCSNSRGSHSKSKGSRVEIQQPTTKVSPEKSGGSFSQNGTQS